MPEEVFILIALSIIVSGGIALTKTILGYLKTRHGTASQTGLTATELKTLLIEAVHEANAPLEIRLEEIERDLAAARSRNLIEERARESRLIE
jgi:hypothetical protein